ncbi:sarcosine oxidase subunit alpha family protein [Novosphingobium nitrogenifigens DSM 19370]|uniref:Sarcosine oxidase subunit alpha family protein n=1 Tax=Novosphingobium nitrogenifigens DSM 19370 TaxID=983920 RepID=F1ZCT7_9SPHN|nr:sarcosine oxidase subunit alpha family protein [Novosphingobium nitrogenifigens]EGD57574.1 sarcosine oxidase subunit alpha family protein [Novosphingobium nitrogenifigens DSM 19370]
MSGSSFRLPVGGLIDRTRPLTFTFDGKSYGGYSGDTLASALLANGVRLVGRSFKYHRPRGILTAGSEEPNALVTLRSGARAEPNTRATTIELYAGLEATSQNRWPNLDFDLLSVNQLLSPIFVAGFYYKTFMWPAKAWEKLYEPLIRRAAGLGALSGQEDPDHYEHDHAFCDLLVVGAGPAGLTAALTAAKAGLRVVLADEAPLAGGALLGERHVIDGMGGAEWAAARIAELRAMPNVRVLSRTVVFGRYDDGEHGAIERVADHLPQPAPHQVRQRLWKIVAAHTIMATGATERPLVFDGNDRPGVMLAGAVSTYINRFGVVPGDRAVVFAAADSGWQTAADLIAAGAEVKAVIDARPTVADALVAPVRAAGVPILLSGQVVATKGKRLHTVHAIDGAGAKHRFSVDLLAMAGGWNPQVALAAHLGHKPAWRSDISAYAVGEMPVGLRAAGAADSIPGLGAVLASGHRAAVAVVEAMGGKPPETLPPVAEDRPEAVSPVWSSGPCTGKAFVDYQHDVTASDIDLAVREGFTSVEHLKRYTTLGMATDQGRVGQVNGHGLLAAATGRGIAETGTIRARPPVQPVAIGAFGGHHRGRHFRPTRQTASHGWSTAQGATFVDAGQWKRAQWFARLGETSWRQSTDREVMMTRGGVGICDVSTLGKIELIGPDVGTLLDRLYVNTFSTLAIGKARYGMMLREDGMAFDDGTVTRFAEDRFFMTTTTANAARVMQHVDFARQVLWPDLDAQAVSVTEQWATYAVAGPASRQLLAAAFPDLDLSNAALPYMGALSFRWQGRAARLYRLSFSGELAYEVSVPADLGEALVRHLFAVGARYEVVPYGTEALGVMRIEKGHPAGNELNGTTTAADLGLGRMMSTKKDFIGRAMAMRPALVDPARPRLVGLIPVNGQSQIRGGAHLLAPGAAAVAANDEGYVTSACYSPTLGHPIALALLVRGDERHGQHVVVHDPVRGEDVLAKVVAPVFHDPSGEKLRG